MLPLLFDGHWYTSAVALALLSKGLVIGNPHKTPNGKAVLVFDRGGSGSIVNGVASRVPACFIPQASDGSTLNGCQMSNLMTLKGDRLERIEFDPAALPDLERLAEFDHLPESRKAGPVADGLHKPGDKLV